MTKNANLVFVIEAIYGHNDISELLSDMPASMPKTMVTQAWTETLKSFEPQGFDSFTVETYLNESRSANISVKEFCLLVTPIVRAATKVPDCLLFLRRSLRVSTRG